MKTLFLCILLCVPTLAFGVVGVYEAAQMDDAKQAKLHQAIDRYVKQQSLNYSGPNAGYEFTFTCTELKGEKTACTFSYSDGGGLIGLGLVTSSDVGSKLKFTKLFAE